MEKLEPVLHRPEKRVSPLHAASFLRFQMSRFTQSPQGTQSDLRLQFRVSPAIQQLERLCGKLDVANATAPKLDVRAVFELGFYPCLDVGDFFDGTRKKCFVVDERFDILLPLL